MPDETKETSKRINVRIPIELYSRVVRSYGITEAVVQGLEKLLDGTEQNPQDTSKETDAGLVINMRDWIESLEEQLKVKDSQLEIIDSRMEDRIKNLEEQLRVKDSQLENKDSQLEKQAVHIQTLISQKAIEAPGAKMAWYKFW